MNPADTAWLIARSKELARLQKPRQSGKVFHTKAHERMAKEKYYTPPWVTRCLLRHVARKTARGWWEPAAGDGQIMRAFVAAGLTEIVGSDIAPDAPWIREHNFLTTGAPTELNIVSNPPFGTGGRLAFQFCWHALRLTERAKGMVCMLLRDDFDSAKGRRALFADCPAFDRKIVITDRIRWTNLPQDLEHGPSGSHAWFVWDWQREPGPPALIYAQADVELDPKKGAWLK